MKLNPYPGFENHVYAYMGGPDGEKASMEEIQKGILAYTMAEGTTMEDRTIPGAEDGQEMTIRIIKPAGLPEAAPVVIDFHGGGWVSGNLDIDNARNIAIAEGTPCIVVSVAYRICTKDVHFPAPLEDAAAAYQWVAAHASEFGGDGNNLAIYGTSAGGNITAGLQLYLRDQGINPQPKLAILNCPALTMDTTTSKKQFGTLDPEDAIFSETVNCMFLPPDGSQPNYYAFPSYCPDLSRLSPTLMITAEYDPLRDEGIEYASRILAAGSPCELIVAPRVTHGYCTVDAPLTHWTHRTMCASLRREFGMAITEI